MTDSCLLPGGGDVKIESQKLNFKEKAQAKVGSLDVGRLSAGGAAKVGRASPRLGLFHPLGPGHSAHLAPGGTTRPEWGLPWLASRVQWWSSSTTGDGAPQPVLGRVLAG